MDTDINEKSSSETLKYKNIYGFIISFTISLTVILIVDSIMDRLSFEDLILKSFTASLFLFLVYVSIGLMVLRKRSQTANKNNDKIESEPQKEEASAKEVDVQTVNKMEIPLDENNLSSILHDDNTDEAMHVIARALISIQKGQKTVRTDHLEAVTSNVEESPRYEPFTIVNEKELNNLQTTNEKESKSRQTKPLHRVKKDKMKEEPSLEFIYSCIASKEHKEEMQEYIDYFANLKAEDELFIPTNKNSSTKITVRKMNIVELEADAVVLPTNEKLRRGRGVSGAIFEKAGIEELTEACREIGKCDVGTAVITSGFKLPSKYIIHTVGPQWEGGDKNERQFLFDAYCNSLKLAKENDCHSIGFPLISAGFYEYPADEAWEVAVDACRNFADENLEYKMDIYFAVIRDEMLPKEDYFGD